MAVRKKYDKSVLGRGLDDMGTGRGLDALIDTSDVKTQGSSNLNEIPIEQIEPNPDQPRREFDEQSMQELASSIQTMGNRCLHPVDGTANDLVSCYKPAAPSSKYLW